MEEPESSSKHFSLLIDDILSSATDSSSITSSITRLNVCLWVLYSWCRSANNLEAAYTSSEKALLLSWEKVKENYTGKNKPSRAFDSILDTYNKITDCYVDQCLIPYVKYKHAISHAVRSPCSIDVNIKLFDILGRLSVKGHWVLDQLSKSYTNSSKEGEYDNQNTLQQRLKEITNSIYLLIKNNPLLLSPYKDSQAIDIGLALMLISNNSELDELAKSWISEMVEISIFSFESDRMYPIVHDFYEELLIHKNKDKSDKDYKKRVTEASILYPLLSVFCALYKLDSTGKELEEFAINKLTHTTLQYWYPNQQSEQNMYSNTATHGASSTDFPINRNTVLKHILRECNDSDSFKSMSAVTKNKKPLILTACRCHRYPVPFMYIEDWLAISI